MTRAKFVRPWLVVTVCAGFLAASCGGKVKKDEDGEADAPDEDAEEDGLDADDDVPVDSVMDVDEDGDEEVVDPCPEPGLHTGTPVLVADPGGEIGVANGRGARIAAGGGVVGVGWSDGREVDVVTNEEVFLQVLDPDGTFVGSEVQLSDASLMSRPPAVVWTGDRFTSLWGDDRAYPAGNVFLASADRTGTAVDVQTQVTTAGVNAMFVAAAWTGSRLGMAWTDNRDSTMDVYFALIEQDGTMDGSVTRISDAAGNSFNPSVAWSGTGFYVVWADTMGRDIWEFRIYLSILDSSGAVTSGPTMISGADWAAKMPSAAWSGSVLGVCWEDYRGGGHDVYCASYDAGGAELTAAAEVSSLGGNSSSAMLTPSLVAVPDGFGLAWADENGTPDDGEVYFAHLSADMEVSVGDTPLTDTTGAMTSVSLAWTGTGYGVAWVTEDGAAAGEDTVSYLPFTYCE